MPVQLVRRKPRSDPQSLPQRFDIHVGGVGSVIHIKHRLNGQHLCASRVPIAHRECLSAIRVPGAASQARGQPGWRGETPWDRATFSRWPFPGFAVAQQPRRLLLSTESARKPRPWRGRRKQAPTRPGPGNHASEPGVVFGVCSLNNPGTALCGVA